MDVVDKIATVDDDRAASGDGGPMGDVPSEPVDHQERPAEGQELAVFGLESSSTGGIP